MAKPKIMIISDSGDPDKTQVLINGVDLIETLGVSDITISMKTGKNVSMKMECGGISLEVVSDQVAQHIAA